MRTEVQAEIEKQPARVVPVKPDQPKEVVVPKSVAPVKQIQPVKPVVKPDQKDTTATKPDQVAPTKAEQLEKIKEKTKKKIQEETGQQDAPR